MTRTFGPRAVAPGLFAMFALASGCNPSAATVAGKVTYQGKPVGWGSVTLRANDGSYHQIGLNADGTYRLDNVPVGPAKVGVSSPDPTPSSRFKDGGDERATAPPSPPPGIWFPLPAKFADPATSGVTLDVRTGGYDIELK